MNELLIKAIDDFGNYSEACLEHHFHTGTGRPAWPDYPPAFPIMGRHPDPVDCLILLTALAPHIYPGFYDDIIQQFLPNGGDFPAFGGIKGSQTRYMLPTGDTALFLLAGTHLEKRMEMLPRFNTLHWFHKEDILSLEPVKEGEPKWSGRLLIHPEVLEELLEGARSEPAFGPDFPAKKIATRQIWDDLVLPQATLDQLEDIDTWLYHHEKLITDPVLKRKMPIGCRVLFHGPSGTGKTLAASLIADRHQKPLYRIDLSQVVSKYIGETEKNLEKVFAKAQHRDWILFFDEADSLFGKRTGMQTSNDKYANNEVGYLLQRIEDFPGLVILASNFKNNIDPAFFRRFNLVVHFPLPGHEERLLLWQKASPGSIGLKQEIDLASLAQKYELTGSNIMNVMNYAALQTHRLGVGEISLPMLITGIQREMVKEDKLIKR